MSILVADLTSARVLRQNLFDLFKGPVTLRAQHSWTLVEEGHMLGDKVEMLAGAEQRRSWKL